MNTNSSPIKDFKKITTSSKPKPQNLEQWRDWKTSVSTQEICQKKKHCTWQGNSFAESCMLSYMISLLVSPILLFPPMFLSRKYFQNLLVQFPVSELWHSGVPGTKSHYYKYFSYNISKEIRLNIIISCWLSPDNFKFSSVAVDSEDKTLIFKI